VKDDKEIRERFFKEYNYPKKKLKHEHFFNFGDVPFINQIHDILKEYVMNRLYNGLFPNEPTKEDSELHEKFKALSLMCKPSSISKDLAPYENIIIASIPKAKKYIKQFENERTPLSKKKAFQKLMELINRRMRNNNLVLMSYSITFNTFNFKLNQMIKEEEEIISLMAAEDSANANNTTNSTSVSYARYLSQCV
jgi:hypothetical protein